MCQVITIQQQKNLKTVSVQTAPLPYESIANGNWKQLLHGKIMQCKIYHSLSIVDDTETRLECENNPQHHLARKQTVLGLYVGVGTGTN
jgi:hypothetical protein